MQPRRRVRGAVILLYHRIAVARKDPWSICVSPHNFVDQLGALRQSRRVVSLRQLVRELEEHRVDPDTVAVTFDDGYSDNFHIAKPLLERFSIPATFFLATGYIGQREFWWDELERLVLGATSLTLATVRKDFSLPLDCSDAWEPPTLRHSLLAAWRNFRSPQTSQRLNLLFAIWRRLRALPALEQRRALDELASILGPAKSQHHYTHRPLDLIEAQSLARHDWVEIGAHTVNHPLMSRQPPTSQFDEIVTSREKCEEFVGQAPIGFAYPYGDMGPDTPRLVERAGFKYACTTVLDAVTSETNPFTLPRVTVHDWDGQQLMTVLT